jgi:Trp operon repressor
MLCKGMQQNEIAKKLAVSQATITFDVRALQDNSDKKMKELVNRVLPFIV